MEKKVYNGKIIQVTEEEINGTHWERAYLPDGVIIFPIDENGNILLVKEKRPHENPPFRIKPLSGILEPDKGTPIENAQREMQEEIGLKAGEITQFWELKSTGTINNQQYFFLAKHLFPSKLPNPDGEDSIMEILPLSPEEILNHLNQDLIRWSMSTLGLIRLIAHLQPKHLK